MSRGLLASVALHALVIIATYWQYTPSISRLSDLSSAVPVEMVPIDELTQVIKNQRSSQSSKPTGAAPTPLPAPEDLPPPLTQEPAVQEHAVQKPAPLLSAPTEPEKPTPAAQDVSEISAIALPQPAPKQNATPAPVRPNMPKITAKPAQISKQKSAKKDTKDPSQDFEALLKDLTKTTTSNTSDSIHMDANSDQHAQGKESDKITISEFEALKRHIQKCWNTPAGLKESHNMIIEVEVSVAKDGNVKSTKIINDRPSDPQFRAAAESARRAVLSPKCNPLPLPKEKYEQWKSFVFRFDPKDLR